MAIDASFNFQNRYAGLGEAFGHRQRPAPVPDPQLICINEPLASFLGMDPESLYQHEVVEALAGNRVLPGSDPMAQVYSGHQFGAWNPRLGDGRALLLGEVVATDGQYYDIQLKGSGQTPYSRMGDGRSPLGPVLREYIVSEAMFALGVPTTRSLAAIATGERVFRDSILPGGILTRVASSHIRVGTFQYFFSRDNLEAIRILADHVIERHFASARQAERPYLALLQQTIERQAKLIAQWMSLGFIHGVMNTDNMLICGETIDYGPCAFMDKFNPARVFSSIDQTGRYAYHNQPGIAQWNLAWFAQCLLPLLDENDETALKLAQDAISSFKPLYDSAYQSRMARKLGFNVFSEAVDKLLGELLDIMTEQQLDFTLTFRHLADRIHPVNDPDTCVAELFCRDARIESWIENWQRSAQQQGLQATAMQALMYRCNPALIPRNHLVEEALNLASDDSDYSAFHRLVETLANPYVYQSEVARYATPPTADEEVKRTFCGT